MKKHSTMTAREFDRRLDEGEDITPYIDDSSIRRPGLEARRINVNFPEWIIQKLDVQSKMIGVSRQSLIKLWTSERVQQEQEKQNKPNERIHLTPTRVTPDAWSLRSRHPSRHGRA